MGLSWDPRASLGGGQVTQQTGRVARIDTRFRHVLGHHRASADDDMIANADGEDCGVRADADVIPDARGAPEVPISSGWAAVREGVVDELRAVRDDTVVADRHQLTDKRVRLDL